MNTTSSRSGWSTLLRTISTVCLLLAFGGSAAALGPTNLLILVNKNSQESLAVANHYRALRNIPARNFVYIDYKGDAIGCEWEQFKSTIYGPAVEHIQYYGLQDQIAAWVTTPSFPYRVGKNSISGVIFFGKECKPTKSEKLGPAGFEELNPYFSSMEAWQPGMSKQSGRYLHMMLTAGSLETTLAMLERSVKAEPVSGPTLLFDGEGPRDSRKISIPQSKVLLEMLGRDVQHQTGSQIRGARNVFGVYTGSIRFPCGDNEYAAGAIGDHLTSFGGALFDSRKQMTCTEFLDHGCSASYGTVVEPYNYPQKFPTAMVHAYYAMGFSAIESYWMSVAWPQQGLFVGDPLTRPFANGPRIDVRGFPEAGEASGQMKLNLRCEAPQAPGVSHVELFVNDKYLTAVGHTRFPEGVEVSVKIGEEQAAYQVKTDDRLGEVVQGLARQIQQKWKTVVVGRGGSILINRPVGQGPSDIQASSNSPLLWIETVGGGFRRFQSNSKRDEEVAWLRLGAGPNPLTFASTLDTTRMPNGLHELRVVAHRGQATQSESTRVYPFAVRNGSTRLTLRAVESNGDLDEERIQVCEAELTGLEDAEVIFSVDGRQAGVRNQPPYVLDLYPRDWGQGPHEVAAMVRRDGKTVLLSDNRLTFTITP